MFDTVCGVIAASIRPRAARVVQFAETFKASECARLARSLRETRNRALSAEIARRIRCLAEIRSPVVAIGIRSGQIDDRAERDRRAGNAGRRATCRLLHRCADDKFAGGAAIGLTSTVCD